MSEWWHDDIWQNSYCPSPLYAQTDSLYHNPEGDLGEGGGGGSFHSVRCIKLYKYMILLDNIALCETRGVNEKQNHP